VRLVAQGGATDITLVDSIRVSYWHHFVADDDQLQLTAAGGQTVTISGFTSGSVRVFDVTDPAAVQELAASVEPQRVGFAATVTAAAAGERRLLALTDEKAGKPSRITANEASDLRDANHAADFVIISKREFFPALEPLIKLRTSQKLKVELVDIEDIYDEFSYGNKSPQAVKDFLQYAKASWKVGPRFVLLCGDQSYDPKNYLGLGDWDLMPAKLVDTGLMETASDDWYADFNDDGLAELAVGRLPARTAEEAEAIVAKIISYERSNPSGELLLVSDAIDGYDFEAASDQLKALAPTTMKVNEIKRGRLDAAAAKQALMGAINRGQRLVNYTGHGSVDQWKGDLLTNEDANMLANSGRFSVFLMMTCLNGYGQDPALDGLAEALMKAENGGAVAVWASSGMTNPDAQAQMNQELYRLLFGGESGLTIGELIQRAKAQIGEADVRRTWLLLGDPTMKIR
jgi:hypothetical protein